MRSQLMMMVTAALLLGGCAYGEQKFVDTRSPAEIAASARAIDRAERAERAEFRRERRQELMDEANATRRANQGSRHIYYHFR
ncbi:MULTISPECIES: hypothetical protein [Eikenella]|uniref:Lipoprotein n=1 Tax=Eikenella longinqua TaxID=1795827 RepID=A0A1A9S2E2_9NEIS|nr:MULTISPECIES: hypothetical protein [Eikenella]OAM31822.1 hypothetical protein A7P95_00055 [Eikenella longinqua]